MVINWLPGESAAPDLQIDKSVGRDGAQRIVRINNN